MLCRKLPNDCGVLVCMMSMVPDSSASTRDDGLMIGLKVMELR